MSQELESTTIRPLSPKDEKGRKRQAVLLVMTGPTTGQTIYLESKEEWKMGRSMESDIIFQDESVSRNHCRVYFEGPDKWNIDDLNSANGTWINGTKISSATLKGNDKVQLGSTIVLKFVLQDEIEAAFQKELYESATKDSLTGLQSKRYFLEQLEIEFNYHRRTNRPLSVVFLDIDHFKKINDTHGHPAGDMVLNHLGGLLLNILRRGDSAGRYGGEELIFLLRETPLAGAKIFAERLRMLIQTHSFIYNGTKIPVTSSFGAATYTNQNFKNPTELLKSADDFLYKAKKSGRNRVACLIP